MRLNTGATPSESAGLGGKGATTAVPVAITTVSTLIVVVVGCAFSRPTGRPCDYVHLYSTSSPPHPPPECWMRPALLHNFPAVESLYIELFYVYVHRERCCCLF